MSTGYRAFHRAAPDVTLRISVGITERLIPLLLAGELDLIMIGMSSPAEEYLVQKDLFHDKLVAAASVNHRLAGNNRETLADAAKECWAFSAANVQR